jgi:FAD/FMN-containing dehydrogenase
MGGQQFLTDGSLLDMRRLSRVRAFDEEHGLLQVEAGITWPGVIRGYLSRPNGKASPWGIRQKQTGADRLTIGGAVAANIHGRCLTAPPFIGDIESLELVTADGAPDWLYSWRRSVAIFSRVRSISFTGRSAHRAGP